jgi:hypothetical protein
MKKLTQLQISLGKEWTVAGEANSSNTKEMIELKRLEWDMRNKFRDNPHFKSRYQEIKE